MQLPEKLQEALECMLDAHPPSELKSAAEKISAHYREERNSKILFEQSACRLAYLLARMPATYAAIATVLSEVAQRINPTVSVRSLLDLGAGPGTGGWAVSEIWPDLSSATCLEQSAAMAALGSELFKFSEHPSLQKAKWLVRPVQEVSETADLALLSYVIGEMSESQSRQLFEKLASLKIPLIVVIEPGTKAGFQRILNVRNWAIARGFQLVAPCPHRVACPLEGKQSWCHFPARVERSRIHKFLKGGTLGYEDEKFSYVAFGNILIDPPRARVVGMVQKMSGFVRLPVCSEGKIQEIIVSKKQTDYRSARDASWGSALK